MVTLFIGFYLTALAVGHHQQVMFYLLFAATHAVDLVWFLPIVIFKSPAHLWRKASPPVERAQYAFVVLDALTIILVLCLLGFSAVSHEIEISTHILDQLGIALIVVGVADIFWNRRFYFREKPTTSPSATPAIVPQSTPVDVVQPTKIKLIYVVGPYRASGQWQTLQNIRLAEAVTLDVWRLGAACICPHKNTAFFGGGSGRKCLD